MSHDSYLRLATIKRTHLVNLYQVTRIIWEPQADPNTSTRSEPELLLCTADGGAIRLYGGEATTAAIALGLVQYLPEACAVQATLVGYQPSPLAGSRLPL